MNIKGWLEKCTLVRVDHGKQLPSEEIDWEETNKASNRRSKFSTSFVGAGVVVFLASGLFNLNQLLINTEGLDKQITASETAKNVRDNMSPHSELLNALVGNNRVSVISQDDPNLKGIVSLSSIDLLPKSEIDAGNYSVENILKMSERAIVTTMSDEISSVRYFALKHMMDEENKERAHVYYGSKELEHNLCFAQLNTPEYYEFQNGMIYSNESNVARVQTAVHELAHCIDLRDFHHSIEGVTGYTKATTLQSEIIADATAMIYMAGNTGSWEAHNHTTDFMRTMSGDLEHSTKVYLDEIKKNLDPSKIGSLTIRQSFELAVQKHQELDFNKLSYRAVSDLRLNKIFVDVVNGNDRLLDINESDMVRSIWEKRGFDSNESIQEFMRDYSEGVYRKYLNHIQYTGVDSEKTIDSALEIGERIAEIYGNDDLKNAVETNKKNIDDGQGLDLKLLVSTLENHNHPLPDRRSF